MHVVDSMVLDISACPAGGELLFIEGCDQLASGVSLFVVYLCRSAAEPTGVLRMEDATSGEELDKEFWILRAGEVCLTFKPPNSVSSYCPVIHQ